MKDKIVSHFLIYRTYGVKSPCILDPIISNAYFIWSRQNKNMKIDKYAIC